MASAAPAPATPPPLLQVRVLQCVSSAVELLGDRLRPHLATICAALPQVWQVISQRQQQGAGGLARLHSALISTGGWGAIRRCLVVAAACACSPTRADDNTCPQP